MEYYVLLFVLYLFVSPSTQLSQGDVKLVSSHEYANINEEVILRCEVSNIETVSGYIYFAKEVNNPVLSDLITQEISADDVILHNAYKSSGRFSVQKVAQEGLSIFTMTIAGVQAEDSGIYVCGDTTVIGTASLHVYRQAEDVIIEQQNKTLTDNTLKFKLNTPSKVSCQFTKVNPVPEITVSTISNNYSSGFSKVETFVIPCAETGISGNCILEYYYNVTVYNDMFLPNGLDHGEELVCSANFPDSELPAVEKRAKINVEFDPIIVCGEKQEGILHMKAEVTCNVHANPMATDFHWMIPTTEGELVPLKIGESYSEYRASAEHVGDTTTKVTLYIQKMMQYHVQAYTLVVENENITQKVALVENTDSTISLASNTNGVWTAMVTVFAAIVTVLLHKMN